MSKVSIKIILTTILVASLAIFFGKYDYTISKISEFINLFAPFRTDEKIETGLIALGIIILLPIVIIVTAVIILIRIWRK